MRVAMAAKIECPNTALQPYLSPRYLDISPAQGRTNTVGAV